MEEDQKAHSASWDSRVTTILAGVYREANILMWLGLIVYVGGSGFISWLLFQYPGVMTFSVMFFFQTLVIFFGTRKIYPCIAGSFRIMIAANRDAVPAFEDMGELVRDLKKASKDGDHPVVKRAEARLDKIAADMAAIRARVERDSAPLPVRRRPAETRREIGDAPGELGGGVPVSTETARQIAEGRPLHEEADGRQGS